MGKVRADQLFPGIPGDLDGRGIHIADGPISVDGDQRVETCLNQAPVIGICPADRLLRLFSFGDVTGSRKDTGNRSRIIQENCCIIQYRRYPAVPVPDLQGIVRHRSIPEHCLIPGLLPSPAR